MTGGTGGLHLLVRSLRSGVAPSVLAAVVVLIGAFLAVAAPLTLLRLGDDELRTEVGRLPDPLRGLQVSDSSFPSSVSYTESAAKIWEPITDAELQLEAELPASLSGAIGQPVATVATDPRPIHPDSGSGIGAKYTLIADPDFTRRVRWVRGGPPELWPGAAAADPDTGSGYGAGAPAIPMAVSTSLARDLKIGLGSRLTGSDSQSYVITGIWAPRDRHAQAWRLQPTLLSADFTTDEEHTVFAAAEISARSPAAPLLLRDGGFTVLFPVDGSQWRIADGARIAAGLQQTVSRGLQVHDAAFPERDYPLVTDTTSTVSDVMSRAAALDTTGALVAAGPFAVLLLVLGLGTAATLERRRPTIAALRARGASGWRIRGGAAAEGVLVGVPAAVLGVVLAVLVVPEQAPAAACALAALLGIAPAVLGFALARPRLGGDGAGRDDLGSRPGRARRRIRLALELAVVALAIALTATLLARGPAQDPSVLDPLLVTAPVALALAVGVVVLRLYPLPLRAAEAALRRGRRASGFLGIARGIREPTLGLPAALAIVVGVSVAALSATVYVTVDAATYASARAQVGADVRANVLSANLHGPIPTVAGMRDPVPFADQGSTSFGDQDVDLVTAPLDRLARIRTDIPHGMAHLEDGAIPVLVSADLQIATGTRTRLYGHDAVVVGQIRDDADIVPLVRWVLADSRYAARLTRVVNGPFALLSGVTSGSSVPAVAARLKAALPSGAVITNAQSVYEDLRRVPTIGGLAGVLVAASVGAAALSVLTAVLAVAAATRRRDRTMALLKILGLSSRQGLGMIVAELLPLAIVLVAMGTGLGLGLAALVVASVDLTPFTGGTGTASIVVAPGLLAAIAGGFLVLSALATTIAARLSSRIVPADIIRVGE